MRKARYLSIISLFVLVICVISAGVFAASSIKDVQVTGTISLPSNVIGVTVKGFYGTSTAGAADYTYSDVNLSWSLNSSYMTFDAADAILVSDVSNSPITLSFLITNDSGRYLDLYFTKNAVLFTGETILEDETTIVTVGVTGVTSGHAYLNPNDAGSGTSTTLQLTFTLNNLPQEDVSSSINYVLHVDDYEPA